MVFTFNSGTKKTECIGIINIETSYSNRILQKSMDRIIDIFGKRKNGKSRILNNSWI